MTKKSSQRKTTKQIKIMSFNGGSATEKQWQDYFNLNDPFLDEDFCFERLWNDYQKHKNIVVAVDWDNTLFDLHKKNYKFPAVIELLKKCQNLGFYLVIFSASPRERHEDISQLCEQIGLKIRGINCDVVDWNVARTQNSLDYSQSKIFYNVFLCDRAGLPSSYRILKKLVDKIVSNS